MKCMSLQIATFWKDGLNNPELFANRVNLSMDNLFNDMIETMNVPEEIPVDIPIVQKCSIDKQYILNIARKRCDFIINNNILSTGEIGGTLQRNNDLVIKYLNSILNEKELVRVGVIITGFEENNDAIKLIVNKYFNTDNKNIKEIGFRINVKEKLKDLELNSIIDVSHGELINEQLGLTKYGLVIQRDINNVHSDVPISKTNIMDIWKFAITKCTNKGMGEI